MEHQPRLTATSRPKLAAKVLMRLDPLTQEPILLYPEGVVKLNETGASIVRLCDGESTLDEIVQALAQLYHVEAEPLRQEVMAYLQNLYRYSLLAWH
ncbi:pyrroloquinoline quinone biosynthesis peptide chaperone PqqD [Ktedonosporobacter rubrisoli]|uniref:Pyrroloquinoline quinone biosynthesis peptide chaperone PqqD n=2 Tax=Ktedonosporobacter rubrisoli TaxID=2509675 RepID=A0A4P6K554_KTERU|nr:pyrroloquinoline quinone biosynthesis peptide chaperone PqqD [Ktedonosporobacter rubrisoli]